MSEDRTEIPGTAYSYESSLAPGLARITEQVTDLRRGGRLSSEVLVHLRRFFRIKNIHNSNAIEGNTLDIGETRLVVERGLTITGKPLKDQTEAKNLAQAIDFLEELASSTEVITERDVREIHQLVLQRIDEENAGSYRRVEVEISGSSFKPPGPESISAEMAEFSRWLASAGQPDRDQVLEGVLAAAVAHTWLVTIHPFADGNGRVARLLMNLVLMRYGVPIAIISKEDRLRYYDALEESQSSDISPFLALIIECLHESLEEYERAAEERKERLEWVSDIAQRFSEGERRRFHNEYEVWKSSMELLRSHFKQTSELLNERALFFKVFGHLDFERYATLRAGESVKRTWFFRLDFRAGERAARYLFFFGFPSRVLRDLDATLHLSREEPTGSFYYERLDSLPPEHVPGLVEIGYQPDEEKFVFRDRQGERRSARVDVLCKRFFEDVVRVHFGGKQEES